MPIKKHIIACNQLKQLVDLNGDSVNFDLKFRAYSKDKAPFDALVVDQNTLDSNPDLQYKRADSGSMGGSIVSDKDKYENYFLIVKSDKPCEIICEVDLTEIPARTDPHQAQPTQAQPTQAQPTQALVQQREYKRPTPTSDQYSPWIIGAIAVGAVLVLYYLFAHKKGGKNGNNVRGYSVQPAAPPNNYSSLLSRLNSLPDE